MFILSQNKNDLLMTETIGRLSIYNQGVASNPHTCAGIEAILTNGEHIQIGKYHSTQACQRVLTQIKHCSKSFFDMPSYDDIKDN